MAGTTRLNTGGVAPEDRARAPREDVATTPAPGPWLDASLPVDERVDLLLAEMTLDEKAGLFFHTMIGVGDLDEANPTFALPSAREYSKVGR